MTTYGQFCPVAKAMEVLDERWTMLIVRELLCGSSRFNELRRGMPRMSPALLTTRLRSLERVGLVQRSTIGGHASYELTESGLDLRDVVQSLGLWGLRHIGELGDKDLDPHLLFFDISRTISLDDWPRSRTVLAFQFSDVAPAIAEWWFVVSADEVDVCDQDPGYEIAATVETSLRTLTQLWRGDVEWDTSIGAGEVSLIGPEHVRRSIPQWLGKMSLAQLSQGREA